MYRPTRRGVTLLEMTIVAVIVVVVIALLFPTLMMALERAKRMRCAANLQQMGLAVEMYQGSFNTYPSGCRFQNDGTAGTSWWLELLPFLDNNLKPVSDNWQRVPNSGDFNTEVENPNVQYADGMRAPVMFCPSSPLPQFNNPQDHISDANRALLQQRAHTPQGIPTPHYVAVSGSAPDMHAVPAGAPPVAPAGRNTRDESYGVLSASGAFPPNSSIREANIKKSKSAVILFGEQSDWGAIRSVDPPVLFDIRSCWPIGAFHGATGNYGTLSTTAPGINGSGEARCYNVTTLRHPLNTKTFDAGIIAFVPPLPVDQETGQPPVVLPPNAEREGPGHNHGIFSAHSGGANVIFADQSVRFLSEEIDLSVFLRLGTRDDEVPVQLP